MNFDKKKELLIQNFEISKFLEKQIFENNNYERRNLRLKIFF